MNSNPYRFAFALTSLRETDLSAFRRLEQLDTLLATVRQIMNSSTQPPLEHLLGHRSHHRRGVTLCSTFLTQHLRILSTWKMRLGESQFLDESSKCTQ